MRILIRIVFVIFIANGIDCLGRVCDNCCDCFKEEKNKYEEIKEDKNNTAESLVNTDWYEYKKDNLVLKIFKKEDNIFTSTENENKISFKLDEKDNSKIAYQNKTGDPLNLEGEKYALFEIETQEENMIYLYCSDVESLFLNGIFEKTTHVSISVIACDTEEVTNMGYMFSGCNSLENLDISNFNTIKVTNMCSMFYNCCRLKEINLKNFNTENVTNMGFMFCYCRRLKEINLKNFNTEKVMNMSYMFSCCENLKKLDIKNFNTTNVMNMNSMFSGCRNLTELELGENFNIENNPDEEKIFDNCKNLSPKIIYRFFIKKK